MASVKLTPEPRSVGAARSFVAAEMDRAGVHSSSAILLTSELASNVVQHARTDFDVVVEAAPDRVRVEIHDGASATDAFRELISHHPGAPNAEAESGRGLVLLLAHAGDCGLIDRGPEGKTVWFELEPDD